MKFSNVFRTVTAAAAVALAAQTFAQEIVSSTPLPDGSGVNVNWLGDPGAPHAAYVIVGKPSLVDPDTGMTDTNKWSPVSDYITPITEWQFETTVPFAFTNDVMFYRVERVDREGPSIEYVSPVKDAVSVPVDAEISVRVTDDSGVRVDNSLAIYVGEARHAYGDDDVSWDNGVLTYTPTNSLGNPGDTVDVWATATDTCGNVGSSEQSLLVLASDIETLTSDEPQVVPFLVIPSGKHTVSELIDAVSTNAGPSTAGARAAGDNDTLEIVGTTSNTLVFAYSGDAWQLLAVGQLWASDDAENIFYRKITAIGEPEDGRVTVDTSEATLADFFVGGSFSSDDPAGHWTEYDVVDLGEGEAASAQSRRRVVRPRISGGTAKNFSTNGNLSASWLNAKLPSQLRFVGRPGYNDTGKEIGEWDVGAGFSVAADFSVLKRKFNSCDLAVTGKVHVLLHPRLVTTTNMSYSNTWTKTIANVKKTFAGTIGPVPVWVDVGVEVPVELRVQAQATNASVQATIDISRALDFRWRLSDDQWKQIGSGNTGWVIAETNFTYEVEGSAGVRASIKPTLTVKVYSLIGANGWVEPYLEANALGRVQGHNLVAPDFYYLMTAYAGLNAGVGLELAVWNDDWGTLPSKTFSPLRKQLLYLEGTNRAPSIVTAPESYTADAGETVMFSVIADGTWPLRYAWYHNGKDTGRRDAFITLTAGEATAGNYQVRVMNGYGTNSATARLNVVTNIPIIGTWRFLYQWEGAKACSYAARIYTDGSMHDTSPNDYWWDWHLNGKTVRFETREKWDGASAVYRGTRWGEKFMSGTMSSPGGRTGTWSMEWVSGNPEFSVDDLLVLRAKAVAEADDALELDPAGLPLGVLAAP